MDTTGMSVRQNGKGFSIFTKHNLPLAAITYRSQEEADQTLTTLQAGGELNNEGRAVSAERINSAKRAYDAHTAKMEQVRGNYIVVNGEWPTWPE